VFNRARTILPKALTALFLLGFAVFGLKGCIVTVWRSPAEPTTYGIRGVDGRSLYMVLMPENETLIWYRDPSMPSEEIVLAKMRGEHATHYLGSLWHVEAPRFVFGYRLYPADSEPIVMETEYLKKSWDGQGKECLQRAGRTTRSVFLFRDDAVQFADMWLRKEPTDEALVEGLLAKVNSSKTKNVPTP
jgi:hypothetical protein